MGGFCGRQPAVLPSLITSGPRSLVACAFLSPAALQDFTGSPSSSERAWALRRAAAKSVPGSAQTGRRRVRRRQRAGSGSPLCPRSGIRLVEYILDTEVEGVGDPEGKRQ